MNKVFLLVVLLSLFIPAHQASAQSGFLKKNTRVKLTPTNKSYRLEDEDIALQDGYFKEQERWIVFSDRAGNIAYKAPGSEIQLKSLGFMEACYVIGERDGYLELVKHNAKLIKTAKAGKIDRKSAEYLGWIPKSRLLLWRMALKENNTKFYVKAITSFKNQQIFTTLHQYAIEDSLLLFAAPSLNTSNGKCAAEELFYIFKQSDDGRQYLLGREPQITNNNQLLVIAGWVSRDVVKIWGTRLFVTANPKVLDGKPANNAPIFYSDSSAAGDPEQRNHNFFSADSLATYSNPLERIFPVQHTSNFSDSTTLLKTSVLADVLDRSENEIINVLGHKIHYADFQRILSNQRKTNIVFVMDGGKENGKYLPNVLTILQNLEVFFDTNRTNRHVNYGAVVYKDNLSGKCKTSALPLTPNYSSVVGYFYERQQEIGLCNNDTIAQAMFSGVMEATKLLAAHKDENNIILLIGAAGNNMDGNINYADVISRLSYVRAKMLVFQTHSIPHPSYNDFVIQSKNLVLKSAANISELKKEKLVDLKDVLNDPSFSLAKGDSGVYYLDFPERSMTQGYVLFPGKGGIMRPSFLERQLDSLMRKMYVDNERIEASLFHFFNTVGVRNTHIGEAYKFNYPLYDTGYLPLDFLKSLAFRGLPYSVPGWLVYNDYLTDSLNNLKYGVLLSTDEYEQVIHALSDLAGDRDYTKSSRRVIYRHLYITVSRYLANKSIDVDERISRLSISESLEWLTGYRSANPLWTSTELRMIKKDRKFTKQQALLFLKQCGQAANRMKQNINNKGQRFFSNGQTYYLLTADHLL